MQKQIINLCNGPYKDEAEFQQAFLKRMRARNRNITFFEIENEKEPGMPDILAASYGQPSVFTELKYIRKDGFAFFTNDQPAWYKRNKDLRIQIICWDSRNNTCVYLDPKYVVKQKSLKIPIAEECYDEIDFEDDNDD